MKFFMNGNILKLEKMIHIINLYLKQIFYHHQEYLSETDGVNLEEEEEKEEEEEQIDFLWKTSYKSINQ